MIDVNISQMNAYQLINLSEKQISEIENAMNSATQFVKSGSELLPIVTLKTHNDYFADEQPPFELEVETSFGLKKTNYKNQTEFVKTAVYSNLQREGKEQELLLLSEFNKIAGRFVITTVKNERVAYLGFFECVYNRRIAQFLFKKATQFVKEKGYIPIFYRQCYSFLHKKSRK